MLVRGLVFSCSRVRVTDVLGTTNFAATIAIAFDIAITAISELHQTVLSLFMIFLFSILPGDSLRHKTKTTSHKPSRFMYFGPLLLPLWVVLFSTFMGSVEAGELLTKTVPEQQQQHRQRRPMAGGWTESTLDDPMVLEAADFLLQTLLEEPARYSFLSSAKTTKTTAQVIQASQQVVAGMNFQLTLLVQSPSSSSSLSSGGDCLGAFTATVYNRFGDLTVTDWNEELTCAQAKILMEETQAGNRGADYRYR